mgnify:CR=1 FL=1
MIRDLFAGEGRARKAHALPLVYQVFQPHDLARESSYRHLANIQEAPEIEGIFVVLIENQRPPT